ncbi:hypothetical protein HPB47_026703 [Ixodes persulcatus]|uniref:Uncharacterized protein n=1 Tax=Ixodes persulcatus TaxID=34615 RepID=A0AC60PY56_IXOPE|nr:hypothetical protein HPB47_026703 [Ixodes persulcatus]
MTVKCMGFEPKENKDKFFIYTVVSGVKAAKVVIDLHIQNGHLQQQNRELQVCSAGAQHVVSFKHQGEQARPGEQTTLQELAKPEPPELFLMPLSNMEQFCAAEAQLKNFTNRTLPEEQLVSLGDSKNLQKVVREMVGRLFSKQVQEQFSLLGYRGKSRFKDAMMCNVVIGAICNRHRPPSIATWYVSKFANSSADAWLAVDAAAGRSRKCALVNFLQYPYLRLEALWWAVRAPARHDAWNRDNVSRAPTENMPNRSNVRVQGKKRNCQAPAENTPNRNIARVQGKKRNCRAPAENAPKSSGAAPSVQECTAPLIAAFKVHHVIGCHGYLELETLEALPPRAAYIKRRRIEVLQERHESHAAPLMMLSPGSVGESVDPSAWKETAKEGRLR